nr:MAG TPA: hypothetical protein [Caudoviricetes sp.]
MNPSLFYGNYRAFCYPSFQSRTLKFLTEHKKRLGSMSYQAT